MSSFASPSTRQGRSNVKNASLLPRASSATPPCSSRLATYTRRRNNTISSEQNRRRSPSAHADITVDGAKRHPSVLPRAVHGTPSRSSSASSDRFNRQRTPVFGIDTADAVGKSLRSKRAVMDTRGLALSPRAGSATPIAIPKPTHSSNRRDASPDMSIALPPSMHNSKLPRTLRPLPLKSPNLEAHKSSTAPPSLTLPPTSTWSPSLRSAKSPSVFSRASSSTPTSAASTSPVYYSRLRKRTLTSPLKHEGPPRTSRRATESSVSQNASTHSLDVRHNKQQMPISDTSHTRLETSSAKAIVKPLSTLQLPKPVLFPPPRTSSRQIESSQEKAKGGMSYKPDESESENSPFPVTRKVSSLDLEAKPKRPKRPSRDGAVGLNFQNLASPVIHSNMTRIPMTGHKKREDVTVSSSGSASNTGVGHGARKTPILVTQNSETILPEFKHMTNISTHADAGPSDRVLPEHRRRPSSDSARSKLMSPFGFLSKYARFPHSKSEIGLQTPRKGPAAGTGYEGYGRFAHRGRRPSVSTASSGMRSTSTSRSRGPVEFGQKTSVTSGSEVDMDEFLRERLAPVVIRGGNNNLNNSNQGIDGSRVLEQNHKNNGVQGASLRKDAERGHSSETEECTRAGHSLCLPDRSRHRSDNSGNESNQSLDPMDNTRLAQTTSIDSHGTSHSSSADADECSSKRGHSVASTPERKKKNRLLKMSTWVFSKKAKIPTEEAVSSPTIRPSIEPIRAKISPVDTPRPIAHYTRTNSLEKMESLPLNTILQEIETSRPSGPFGSDKVNLSFENSSKVLDSQRDSTLLPESPIASLNSSRIRRSESPRVPLHRKPTMQFRKGCYSQHQEEFAMPSPLENIAEGSTRMDREHRPSVQSFSRPFNTVPPRRLPTRTSLQNPRKAVEDTTFHDLNPSTPRSERYYRTTASVESSPLRETLSDVSAQPSLKEEEEEIFPSFIDHKKDTEELASSCPRHLDPMVPEQMQATLSEDEVWDEYDDLIEHALSPLDQQSPFGSPQAEPQSSHSYASSVAMRSRGSRANSETWTSSTKSRSSQSGHFSRNSSTQTDESPTFSPRPITAALSKSPTRAMAKPFSFANFHVDSTKQHQSSQSLGVLQLSTSTHDRNDGVEASEPKEIHSGQRPNSNTRYRDSELLNFAEHERRGPIAHANLRFGALMTSRWLSFGRVLFSPAHNEVQGSLQTNVLVIDGLGNEDWSFYCARCYPNANIYNVSPNPLSEPQPFADASPGSPRAWKAPPNHHQIFLSSLSEPFPFPRRFFTVIVVRFPPAVSETAYGNVISECKRALQPGGFVELSILDIDMLNAGNHGRRAVKNLKVRLMSQDPDVCLRPVSDNVQRLLGRFGFENLNRCTVGIPVASHIRDSVASSSSDSQGPSLSDMLNDPSTKSDERITKMISRVGQWWYTQCYEAGIMSTESSERNVREASMWSDHALLRECDERRTNFKLLLCYAQKPVVLRRRTVSI